MHAVAGDDNDRVKTAISAVRSIIANQPPGMMNPYQASLDLGVNSAHLSVLLNNHKLSPTLDQVLVEKGFLDPLPRPVKVQPCAKCGEAHTVDWCTREEGEPKKPRKKSRGKKRKRRPRFSVAADDPEMAMNQLEKYYPGIFSMHNGQEE